MFVEGDRRMIRKANVQDIPKITAIFDQLHTAEELGHSTTGWLRGIYPTEDVAAAGVRAGDMIVVEEDGEVCAAARINQEQCEEYAQITWEFEAREEQVLVLHTLVVSPRTQGRGCARQILAHYEQEARDRNCTALRIDTNFRNQRARAMYRKYGYRESGVVDCDFNGIPNVQMVCLEKRVKNTF